MGHRVLQPADWAKPKGYANGIEATGRQIFIGGQIGWDANQRFTADDFVGQTRQALTNILTILAEAEAGPKHLVRLTWYIVDLDEYNGCQRALGQVYREIIGPHYPAMSLVQVVGLAEPKARVEIEATAVV